MGLIAVHFAHNAEPPIVNTAVPVPLFALPDVAPLLREELAHVPAQAARQPSGDALLVQACAANRELAIDARHLGLVRLHVRAAGLAGDVVCAAGALPWEDAAFQLVVAQHAGDMSSDADGLVDELARVLAPGGVLLWFGLNPWSPWNAWVRWRFRRDHALARTQHADPARRRLLRQRLAPAALEYLGPCWPQRAERAAPPRLLAPLRGAYLITATKQRAMPIPLRQRRPQRMAIQPQLATPSRRASA